MSLGLRSGRAEAASGCGVGGGGRRGSRFVAAVAVVPEFAEGTLGAVVSAAWEDAASMLLVAGMVAGSLAVVVSAGTAEAEAGRTEVEVAVGVAGLRRVAV